MEQFEKSTRNKERRASRQLAMQRMVDAATILNDEEYLSNGSNRSGSGSDGSSNGNDGVKEGIKKSDKGSDIKGDMLKSPPESLSDTNESSSADQLPNTDDYSFTPTVYEDTDDNVSISHQSVTSASNFLKQWDNHPAYLDSQPTSNSSNTPPILSQTLKKKHKHPWNNKSIYSDNDEDDVGYVPSSASSVQRISSKAKQFLWDDQSTILGSLGGGNRARDVTGRRMRTGVGGNNIGSSGASVSGQSVRSRTLNTPWNTSLHDLNSTHDTDINLHDIKHSFRHNNNSKGGFSLWNLLPFTNNNNRQQQNKEKLSLTAKESLEYGEMEVDDSDDDSFMGDDTSNNNLSTVGNSDGLTKDEEEGKRVYLDKHGNLSYNNNSLHARRMWNSYKRYLKCPCLVLFIVCAIGGLYSLFILTGNAIVNVNGIHLGNGNKGNKRGEGYNETKFEGGEWVEDDIRGKGHNEEKEENDEVLIEPEEEEVIVNLPDNLSTEQHAKIQSIENEIASLQSKEQQIYEASLEDENLAKVIETLEDPIENEISALKQKEEEIISSGSTHHEEVVSVQDEEKPVLQATPQKQRFDHIRAILLSHKVSNPLLFEDHNTPQYAALNWLSNVDERQLDPNKSGNVQHIIQRYGLVVLWFGTVKSGTEWQSSASTEDEVMDGDVTTPTLDISGAIDEAVENKENGSTRRRLRQRRRILQSTEQQQGTDHKVWFRHSNWLSSDGICSWEGISCHPHDKAQQDSHNPNNDGDVSRIELRRNNLHGLIPDEVYTAFEYLNVLDLSDNGLAGTISEINKWNSLQVLNYTSNNIAGSIPLDAMDGWHSLKELHLANNLLDGSIPHTIGALSNLKHLNLAGNSIKGTIPYEIGQLSNLSTLDLSYNLLVGELPHELSNLITLVTLNVGNNDLGGPLITELKHTKFIQRLILNDNHFSGELPGSELGSMDHLDELLLNNNDFRGTLPKEISNLIGLGKSCIDDETCLLCLVVISTHSIYSTSSTDKLNLANNHFEGEFPPEWTEMASLRELDVSSNELQGPLPVFIGSMKNLRSLNMAHNKLTSSIPRSIGGLNKLEHLFMDDNEFGSDVPTEMGQLSNLKILSLHNNYLIGTIDDRICKLSSELFLTQLSADCGGEIPEISCDCCMCQGKY